MKNLSIRHGKSSGNKSVLLLTVLALGTGFSSLSAQTNAASDQITAQPAADRIVPFRLSEQGVVRPVEWVRLGKMREISAVARDLWKR